MASDIICLSGCTHQPHKSGTGATSSIDLAREYHTDTLWLILVVRSDLQLSPTKPVFIYPYLTTYKNYSYFVFYVSCDPR